MAQQNSGGRPTQGVSTLNLNSLTADSAQLDYLAKEQQAAGELLTIQTKNAQKLSQTRLNLLKKLMDETKKQSEDVETDLAEFKTKKTLENLAVEIKEVKASYEKLYNEQLAMQKQALAALRQAEVDLASFRLSSIKLESAQKLKDIAAVEKATIDSLKRRSALDPGFSLDPEALAAAEDAINSTLATLDSSLQELETNRSDLLAAAVKREAELMADLAELPEEHRLDVRVEGSETIKALSASTKAFIEQQQDLDSSFASLEANQALAGMEDSVSNAEPPAAPEVEPAQPQAADERAQILANMSPAEKAELELYKLKLRNLDKLHIQNMLNTEEGAAKYKVTQAEQFALEEELIRRKKEFESDTIAALFIERADAEKKQAEELDRKHAESLKKKLGAELDYLKTIRNETGSAKYSTNFMQDMYTQQASYTVKDENGNESTVTKSKAEMSLDELQKVQAQEKEDINAKYQQQAEAQARETLGEGASEEDIQKATAAFFAQLNEAREQEIATAEEKHKLELDFAKDRAEAEAKEAKESAKKSRKESFKKSKVGAAVENTKAVAGIIGDRKGYADKLMAENPGMTSEEARQEMQAQLNAAMGAMGNFITNLNQKGQTAAMKQASVDTNLQGSQTNKKVLGSYWRKLDALVTMGVGMSPFLKQEDVANQVETLAGMGISYNIQQRAFLNTIKDKIATTFDAADGTLRKLIRIQQKDTTAARLGMESALTSFLNSMYETSEYMHEAASEIRGSLYEATALMEAEKATEYEYQVQKWLGSLYSMGFSNTQKVADTLGKITAGDISGITEGGMGNLLIMAANEASLPIAEILEKGLTPDKTNLLMKSMVEYLAKIYKETGSSNVLAQQYANVFGVTASDLKAAANLAEKGLDTVAGTNKNYGALERHLKTMENSLIFRTSTAEFMENLKENLSYTFATTIANNPVLSGLNNMANMLNDLVGGIEIPFINVYGFGFDLNATVADLMNVAALSGTVLGGVGKLMAGLAGGAGGMMNAFGIDLSDGSADKVKTRGFSAAGALASSGSTTSESGSIVGNESGDDIQGKTISDASEGPEKQIAEAKEEQEDKENARTQIIAGHIIDIYNILNDVVLGSKKFHVQLDVGNNPTSWSSGTWT